MKKIAAGPGHSCAPRSFWRQNHAKGLSCTLHARDPWRSWANICGNRKREPRIENVNRVLGSKFIKVRLFMFQTHWNINNQLSYLCLFFSRFPQSLCLSPSNRKPDIVCCPKTFATKLPLISADHRLLSTQVFEQMNCLFMLLSLCWKKSVFKLFTRKYKLLCQQLPLKRFIIVS